MVLVERQCNSQENEMKDVEKTMMGLLEFILMWVESVELSKVKQKILFYLCFFFLLRKKISFFLFSSKSLKLI